MKKEKYNKKAKSEVVVRNIRMKDNYGPFQNGNEYRVIDKGRDWVKVKNQGSIHYIPTMFVEINPISRKQDEEDIDFEYEMYEDYNF